MMTRRRLGALILSLPLVSALGRDSEAAGGSFYYSGPASDHFDGKRFFNPGEGEDPRGFGDFLRWQFGESRTPWPDAYPSPYRDAPPARSAPGNLRVTLVGHATFLVQVGGLNVLTDPVWSERASPFPFAGPKRFNAPGVPFEALPKIDAVLVSHAHYDHLDLATIARLWDRDRPRIVAPLGNDAIVRAHRADIAVETRDWGESVELTGADGASVTVHLVPAAHWSARGVSDRNHALWAGFVLEGGGRRVYFAGDTGFGGGGPFRRVASAFGEIDLALLPIGAYEPRWFMRAQHMNPDDAVQAFAILGAREALGYHWGTFRLTNEGVDHPPRDLARALAERGVAAERFVAMRPGQVWERG